MYFFFFNAPATPEIYTLSLHDALPICEPAIGLETEPIQVGQSPSLHEEVYPSRVQEHRHCIRRCSVPVGQAVDRDGDRKSTRLNSSHSQISYAVFCLKKKKKKKNKITK